ncbi:solute carrier family 46 member 3 [Lutzomyia longipalpis]|nr:solute carrier family 46 member 3 [Lutzomyia longipalpis]
MDHQLEKTEDVPIAQRQEKWYNKITVEPTMFLYMMAFMVTSVIEQAFYLHKACIVDHNYPAEVCDDLEIHQDIKKEVQITVSNFHQWNNVLGHIFPIILALFLGSWSDRRGRKLPLILGLIGKFYWSIMIIVNSYKDWPLRTVIYSATIPSALTGADVAIFASAFAYISDVSTVSSRTIRVTILDVCYLSTMPTGVALGSYLFSNVVNRNYSVMFMINASCLLAAIIYSLIHLKWQTTSNQRSLREVGCSGVLCDFFDRHHVVESLKTLCRKREMKRHVYLWIFMVAMALYTFQRDEKPMMYLYTQLKFDWNTVTYSNFKTFQSSAYVIMMLAGIPLMSKVFGWPDTVIVMVGACAHASARFFFAFAEVPWVLYIGGAVSSLGPVVAPVLRSMTSKVVPLAERGKVFALLSVFDNAVPLFSGVLYTQVYNATINTHPAGIFWLTMSTQLCVLLFALYIHITLKGRNLAVAEVEKKTTLIYGDKANSEEEDQGQQK